MNLYDFVVRRPGRPTEKYGLRAYDEIILAPMVHTFASAMGCTDFPWEQCLFEPRVIEFNQKRNGVRAFSSPDVSDEIVEQLSDHIVSSFYHHLLVVLNYYVRCCFTSQIASDASYDDFDATSFTDGQPR